jgi:di/tricarboxylate transporter
MHYGQVLMSLCLLTFTLSFQCTTKDGQSVPCSLCGTTQPGDNDLVYACNAYHDAFSAALSGYANNTIWLVFSAFQLGRAVQARPRANIHPLPPTHPHTQTHSRGAEGDV